MSSSANLVIVMDTNVWVSALIWGGPPAPILSASDFLNRYLSATYPQAKP